MSDFEWPWVSRVTPVLQSEAAECGLACLAMIAKHHGHRVNLTGLRQRYPFTIRGATLQQIMSVASDLELAPRAVRLEVDELADLQRPAILHWDLNHFVVLESTAKGKAVILDPAAGRRTLSLAEFGKHFTGVALELTPTAQFKPIHAAPRTRLRDLWSKLTNFRGPFIQVLALSLLVQLASLITPLFMQLAVDEAIGQGDSNLLLILLLGFGLVYILRGVTRGLRDWVILTLGQSLTYQLAGNIIRHLIRLPLPYFEKRHIGDLLSRISSIQPIQSLLSTGLVSALIDTSLLVTTFIVMMLISVPLAFLALAASVIYLIFQQLIYPALRQRSEEEIFARANEETYLMESIRSVRAIKLYGHETMRESGWRNRYAEVISATYRARLYGIQIDVVENLLFDLSYVLIAYFGARAVLSDQMTVGMLLAFLSYRSSFTTSATALINQLQKWRLLGLHLERLSDIVAEKREEIAPAPARGLLPGPQVHIENVSFSYGANEPLVLDRIDFTIPSGSFVAIIGPSGAGKTTLMRLLLGLLPPTQGKVIVDGKPLNPSTLAQWRGRLGAVLQDDYLLTGTLADNIAFFDTRPDQQIIEQAARFACIHDDITAMPMAYQSLISDMGAALSSGQRQRILLARALYRDPDILFLDEGTANLDPDTERRIADSIAELPITRVVIAHRPALVERADYVFELEMGQIRLVRKPSGLSLTDWASIQPPSKT